MIIAVVSLMCSLLALAMAFGALAIVRTLHVYLDPIDFQRAVEQEVSRQLKKHIVAKEYGDQVAHVGQRIEHAPLADGRQKLAGSPRAESVTSPRNGSR